jgi:molybdopterin-guanine dinucleotide biosynthesis protein A
MSRGAASGEAREIDNDATGVVLAGGRSRRFGRDKLAEQIDGRPLLHHAVLRLLEVCERVVVVVAADGDEPDLRSVDGVLVVRDTQPDEGPLRGVAAGLDASDHALVIVVGGDMPDLQPDVLREMLRAARETGAVVVALSDGGEARPLPLVVATARGRDAVATLLDAGERSLRELLGAVNTVVVDEPSWTSLDPERRTLVDVDEPDDVER